MLFKKQKQTERRFAIMTLVRGPNLDYYLKQHGMKIRELEK